jgi:hypothetical protein
MAASSQLVGHAVGHHRIVDFAFVVFIVADVWTVIVFACSISQIRGLLALLRRKNTFLESTFRPQAK